MFQTTNSLNFDLADAFIHAIYLLLGQGAIGVKCPSQGQNDDMERTERIVHPVICLLYHLSKDWSRRCWYIEHWALQGFWESTSHSDRDELVNIPHWSVPSVQVQGVWNEWTEYDWNQ